jgi:integrase
MFMGRRATPGVYQNRRTGEWRVDKVVRGHRLQSRAHASYAAAEEWLLTQRALLVSRLPIESAGITFGEAARRYLLELKEREEPVETKGYLLLPVVEHVGNLPLDQIYDDTLRSFVRERLSQGRKAATVNRSLEVVRHILNTAARKWRVRSGDKTLPLLSTVPLITMLDEEDSREARPISWDEQRKLLLALPPHLKRMALFMLNTGLRDLPTRNLRWSWERQVELDERVVSVFEVPKQFVKGGRSVRYVVCNSVAQSIVDSVRGQHAEFVFVYGHNQDRRPAVDKGMSRPNYVAKPPRPLRTGLLNTAWIEACRSVGLAGLHVHDLRHTVGMRLREAGVPAETRAECLWHAHGGMPQHYAVAQVREVLEALERIKDESKRSNASLRMLSQQSRVLSPSVVPI